MPAEVPTQKQVEASAFIWIRRGWRQLTHPAPQLHLHLLFKAYHGYRRSFSILQPAVCLWWFLTARGFLPEAAVLLCSERTAEKASQSLKWKSSSFSPGHHQRILSLSWVCHLVRGFYQLVNCCLFSSSWINYSSFVWWQECFLSFQTAFSNTISSSCFVSILWCWGLSSHNQRCLNFDSYQRILLYNFNSMLFP